jgi:hypothetical protein
MTDLDIAIRAERARCAALVPPCRRRAAKEQPCDRCATCTAKRLILGYAWKAGEWVGGDE